MNRGLVPFLLLVSATAYGCGGGFLGISTPACGEDGLIQGELSLADGYIILNGETLGNDTDKPHALSKCRRVDGSVHVSGKVNRPEVTHQLEDVTGFLFLTGVQTDHPDASFPALKHVGSLWFSGRHGNGPVTMSVPSPFRAFSHLVSVDSLVLIEDVRHIESIEAFENLRTVGGVLEFNSFSNICCFDALESVGRLKANTRPEEDLSFPALRLVAENLTSFSGAAFSAPRLVDVGGQLAVSANSRAIDLRSLQRGGALRVEGGQDPNLSSLVEVGAGGLLLGALRLPGLSMLRAPDVIRGTAIISGNIGVTDDEFRTWLSQTVVTSTVTIDGNREALP